jgi:manganese oxidase
MKARIGSRVVLTLGGLLAGVQTVSGQRTITADVVALDQAFYNNRLGAFQAGGMIFALRQDVVNNVDQNDPNLTAGKVMLRPDKRPRPMVLRMNLGDCLQVNFQNLLADVPSIGTGASLPFNPASLKTSPDPDPANSLLSQSATRLAGVHVMGMEEKQTIDDNASWVGADPNSLAAPNEKKTYRFCAAGEGAFLLYSTAATIGFQDGFGGQLTQGLFGSVMVEPRSAEWYRSQVTRADLDLATYNAGQLPANLHLAPKGNPQATFTSGGKTYKLWTLTKTGPGGFTLDVTQTDTAGDPVNQNGLLKTRDFHPIINYQAAYANGKPILAMLDKNLNVAHSDLTAIITGPNAGLFPSNSQDPAFTPNPTYPDRLQPFREFAIHYHDDPVATQAFPEFQGLQTPGCTANNTCGVTFALQAARDFFAINYGMASIGPEVWANRINVGPMSQCATCKFEEFFLSSWAVGDPAMVVDFPANSGQKATKALYPDDPSNVYHSYLADHVQFRILHAGTNITHVHHQHAHQWLHSPNSDESDYRDSQMLSPGGAYTLDMTYFGSGNLNQTVGDSIFHCHFYPHFAQGMWSLWRVHDVFEAGTKLDGNGVPVADWNRALPDGEITAGTPIPAVVPLPTLAMAPMPIRTRVCPVFGATDYVQFADNGCPAAPPNTSPVGFRGLVSKNDLDDPNLKEKNPGFPFYIPGVAGQRPPHPPLDFAPEEDASGNQIVIAGKKQYLDGGLPRSQMLHEQGTLYEQHNAWDFTKDNDKLLAVEVDEEGTNVEKVAMATHAVRKHPSFKPNGQPGDFILNGQSAKPGAPFADPAVDIFGNAIPNSDCQKKEPGCVRYKAADIQMDVVLNKKGWHYPQQRIISLWGDVKANLEGTRRPEPLFFRANSDKVVEYWLANLVPTYYELDDFQVRTPTDIIGQHIHLVKFDVTSSDGAGNGFNYEDGTFSNEEVQHLIDNVNQAGGLYSIDATQRRQLTVKEIPFFAGEFPGKYKGAQATIQRWYADPIWNCAKPIQSGKSPLPCKVNQDRTLRTVFTHDHFGPSTHQQVGLYAGLVIEPKDSKWFDSTTGAPLGGRFDGGPTTYQANINVADPTKSYREFLLEFQDRQLAYLNTSVSTPKPYERYGPAFPKKNPGGPWGWVDAEKAINPPASSQPDLIPGNPPTPDLVTNQMFEGAFSLNYFNEPLAYRVASGTAEQTDLINVFRSMPRGDAALNCQPSGGSPINPAPNCQPPVGPLTGFKYPPPQPGTQPTDPYTPLLRAYEGDNVQIRNLVGAHMGPHSFHIHGLSWHFEPSLDSSGFRSTQGMGISEHYEMLFHLPVTGQPKLADYLYIPTSDTTGVQYGNWGLIRGYKEKQNDLVPLSETQAKAFPEGKVIPPAGSPAETCPAPAIAPRRNYRVTAVYAPVALGGPLVYNTRGGQITDPNALMYVFTDDLTNNTLNDSAPREPLILRAAAGECVIVELTNGLPNQSLNEGVPALGQLGGGARLVDVQFETSHEVGLHPQLLAYDVTTNDGFNIGVNPPKTVKPGDKFTYQWYAGRIHRDVNGKLVYTPVEFGAVNLAPADPLMQDNFGLIGALIIEPKGSTWQTDEGTSAAATVTKADKTSFREAVAIVQDDLAVVQVPAINYRTEPFSSRFVNSDFLTNSPALSPMGISRGGSDSLIPADPQTPVFVAEAGAPLRLRVLHPAGLNEQVFELHGHAWQEEPYAKGSLSMVENNPMSQWTGSRDAFGANSSFDVVIKRAGGANAVKGDYLFRTFIGADFQDGMWGLVRVGDPGKDVVVVTTNCVSPGTGLTIAGRNTVNPANHRLAAKVTITAAGLNIPPVTVSRMTGLWIARDASVTTAPPSITVTSPEGGRTTVGAMCPIQAAFPAVRALRRHAPATFKDLERFRLKAPAIGGAK